MLIEGGESLERLALVSRMAFDKTGTLTTGKLELGDVVPLDDRSAADVLRYAAAAERPSEHLIAKAILRAASDQAIDLPIVHDFLALPGAGVSAGLNVGDGGRIERLVVGNRRLMREQDIPVPAEVVRSDRAVGSHAQTVLLVSVDGRIAGVLGVRDTLRPEAARVVRELRRWESTRSHC